MHFGSMKRCTAKVPLWYRVQGKSAKASKLSGPKHTHEDQLVVFAYRDEAVSSVIYTPSPRIKCDIAYERGMTRAARYDATFAWSPYCDEIIALRVKKGI